MIKIIGNKIYDICNGCGKIICLNKWLFGSIHICTTEEEQRLFRNEIAEYVKERKLWFQNLS